MKDAKIKEEIDKRKNLKALKPENDDYKKKFETQNNEILKIMPILENNINYIAELIGSLDSLGKYNNPQPLEKTFGKLEKLNEINLCNVREKRDKIWNNLNASIVALVSQINEFEPKKVISRINEESKMPPIKQEIEILPNFPRQITGITNSSTSFTIPEILPCKYGHLANKVDINHVYDEHAKPCVSCVVCQECLKLYFEKILIK